MKTYIVTKYFVSSDSCIVKAKNKKEAIIKADKGEFDTDNLGDDKGWESQFARGMKKIDVEEYDA